VSLFGEIFNFHIIPDLIIDYDCAMIFQRVSMQDEGIDISFTCHGWLGKILAKISGKEKTMRCLRFLQMNHCVPIIEDPSIVTIRKAWNHGKWHPAM
jgi:hypothetical protein